MLQEKFKKEGGGRGTNNKNTPSINSKTGKGKVDVCLPAEVQKSQAGVFLEAGETAKPSRGDTGTPCGTLFEASIFGAGGTQTRLWKKHKGKKLGRNVNWENNNNTTRDAKVAGGRNSSRGEREDVPQEKRN